MKRLLASLVLVLGCSAQPQRVAAPHASLGPHAEPGVTPGARIGPLAGLGAGVRRVDADLR